MPKVKTHKGTSKRFKTTGSGKVVKRRANRSHFRGRKGGKRVKKSQELSEQNPQIPELIPYR